MVVLPLSFLVHASKLEHKWFPTFLENLTSNFDLEVTEIWTYLRLLVDVPELS